MHTNGVNSLDFKASALEVVDNKTERSTGIGTGEDVFVHEKTPDQVLVLPGLAETSNLQEESTIVVEHVVNLRQESGEVADTDVLGHLETSDVLISTLNTRSVAVVTAHNAALVLFDTSLAKTIVTPRGLITAKSDTGNVSAVVGRGVFSKGSPAAAKIKDPVTGLKTNLLANNGQLVVLELLEGLLPVDIADHTGGVDHAWAEEPSVEVVTSVVVITDLLLIYTMLELPPELHEESLTLRTSVHQHLGDETKQEMLEKTSSELEVGPVMTVLEALQSIALEVNLTIEVLLIKDLHGNLALAVVGSTIVLAVELQVVLDGAATVLGLLGLARRNGGRDSPECHQDGN